MKKLLPDNIGIEYNWRVIMNGGKNDRLSDLNQFWMATIPNHTYHIRILVSEGHTTFFVDGKCYFDYNDPFSLSQGYFGFRSTNSRHEISNYRVYQLRISDCKETNNHRKSLRLPNQNSFKE